MTLRIPDAALWLVVLALVAAGIAALRCHKTAVEQAARIASLERHMRMRDEEIRHLVERRLPALADGLWQGYPIPGPLHDGLADTQFAEDQDRVLAMFHTSARDAEQAAQGLLLAVARKLQGLANNQQVKITDMQQRHDDPLFLEDLMEVDHTNAQILRRAVGIAVVCRAWPGRQHNATPLYDVVRGAIGRIMDYKRVQVVRIEDTRTVAGRVVEPLVVTLAELLENATRLSHPNTSVQVHVQLTHSGLAVVIEDAGVGLNAAEREKALRLLNDGELGIAGLGNPPRFGLAACGALARRYGFAVSVDAASAFGGVRAVINIPSDLLTDTGARPPASATSQAGTNDVTAPDRTTAHGLPKRTRRQPAAAVADTPTRAAAVTAHRAPDQAAAPFGAFQRASHAAARTRPSTEGTFDS